MKAEKSKVCYVCIIYVTVAVFKMSHMNHNEYVQWRSLTRALCTRDLKYLLAALDLHLVPMIAFTHPFNKYTQFVTLSSCPVARSILCMIMTANMTNTMMMDAVPRLPVRCSLHYVGMQIYKQECYHKSGNFMWQNFAS